jgi:hypothetical protein
MCPAPCGFRDTALDGRGTEDQSLRIRVQDKAKPHGRRQEQEHEHPADNEHRSIGQEGMNETVCAWQDQQCHNGRNAFMEKAWDRTGRRYLGCCAPSCDPNQDEGCAMAEKANCV